MAGGFFGGGNGTSATPYLIEDAKDLFQIRNKPTSYFKLVSNINLGEPPYNEKYGWEPINNFTGQLNGNGKKIFNLTINRPDEDNIGLFGLIKFTGATFYRPCYNLCLEEVNIKGGSNVGALYGCIEISNDIFCSATNAITIQCYTSGLIEGKNYIGGIIGKINKLTNTQNKTIAVSADTVSECDLGITDADCTFIGQIVGGIQDLWNASCQYTIPSFLRTIGIGKISANSRVILKPGNFMYDLYNKSVYSGCYMDSALWNPSDFGDTTLNYVDTSELKTLSNQTVFSSIIDSSDGVSHLWSLYDGRYPELKIQSPDYFFVKADDNFYTYNFKTKVWTAVYNSTPSRQQGILSGMKTLQDIPQVAWDFFKTFQKVDIIDIVDKKDSTVQTTDETLLEYDEIHTNSTADEKQAIFRRKFNFNTRMGNLSQLTGW